MTLDPYALQHEGLVQVHRALAAAFQAVIDAPAAEVIPRARGAAGFLLAHHTVEDRVLFPTIRRYSRLRSADVACLDAFDRSHHELHRLADHLLAADAPSAASLARDTLALLTAHTAEEEAGLAVDRLRTMITVEGLDEVAREAERIREELQRGR